MELCVRVLVYDLSGDSREIVEIAEAPLSDAFRADGYTLAGKLGKLYRENVANPTHKVEVMHLLRHK